MNRAEYLQGHRGFGCHHTSNVNGASAQPTVLPDHIPLAKRFLLFVACHELDFHPPKSSAERDRQIIEAYLDGVSPSAISRF
jgi:hypothetical protein